MYWVCIEWAGRKFEIKLNCKTKQKILFFSFYYKRIMNKVIVKRSEIKEFEKQNKIKWFIW
jgi:hypothetical protein